MSLLSLKPQGEDGKPSISSLDLTDGRKSPPATDNAKVPGKTADSQPYLELPLRNTFRASLDSVSVFSDPSSDRRIGRLLPPSLHNHPNIRTPSRSPAPRKTWKNMWHIFWERNKGVTLVLLSQFFGALMVVSTRLLETDERNGGGMAPFQVSRTNQNLNYNIGYH